MVYYCMDVLSSLQNNAKCVYIGNTESILTNCEYTEKERMCILGEESCLSCCEILTEQTMVHSVSTILCHNTRACTCEVCVCVCACVRACVCVLCVRVYTCVKLTTKAHVSGL